MGEVCTRASFSWKAMAHMWFRNVTRLHTMDEEHLRRDEGMTDEQKIANRLEEIYVLAEVGWIARQANVQKAMQDGQLKIHAFVYDKETNRCSRLVETIGEEHQSIQEPWVQSSLSLEKTAVANDS